MILEGIVTTVNENGELNIAPMGPRIGPGPGLERFELRPYRTSTTFRNLKALGEGVFHVTDDVGLLARAAIGAELSPSPPLRPAERVRGWILDGSCHYYEFRAVAMDDREERASVVVETVAEGRLRDFLGFNRARNAIVEAAILATRTAFLPRREILADFDRFSVIVAKTGGPAEEEALQLLRRHVLQAPEHADPGQIVKSS
ncbi:MAG: DUF447 family protein [Isosphaeraceae bacterium]